MPETHVLGKALWTGADAVVRMYTRLRVLGDAVVHQDGQTADGGRTTEDGGQTTAGDEEGPS
jgi:hypothetical protein